MANHLSCYRCGASLATRVLPLSRRDLCPDCSTELHVCRMCTHFSPQAIGQCTEDEAEDVHEKEKANFCEWFRPDPGAFDPERRAADAQATTALAALFDDDAERGSRGDSSDADDRHRAAEDLFK